LVSPGLNHEAIELAGRESILMLAGALTPTEIMEAWDAGADLVKVFPCSNLGGAAYIKALRGPFPDIPFVPTGGVNLSMAAALIQAGAAALGVGGEMIQREALKAGRADVIAESANRFLVAVREARMELAQANAVAS
jgi:2-dehydro-3-deoxyphosphogluconate aldolase/(4S)-4-hydroxy-2-oxoglutarate aldolase